MIIEAELLNIERQCHSKCTQKNIKLFVDLFQIFLKKKCS